MFFVEWTSICTSKYILNRYVSVSSDSHSSDFHPAASRVIFLAYVVRKLDVYRLQLTCSHQFLPRGFRLASHVVLPEKHDKYNGTALVWMFGNMAPGVSLFFSDRLPVYEVLRQKGTSGQVSSLYYIDSITQHEGQIHDT